MRTALLLCTALLHGCCCCSFPGGGDDNASTDGPGAFERWAGEKLAEVAVESIAGGEFDVDSKEGTLTIEVPEGKMTAWSDGRLPPDFPLTLPEGCKIESASTMEGKDGLRADSIVGHSAQSQAELEAWFRTAAAGLGYPVTDPMEAGKAAIEAARAQGAEIPDSVTAEMTSSDGRMLVAQGPDGSSATLLIDLEEDGCDFVLSLTRLPTATPPPAEAP